ncbi:MBL fold metallo-hydrolase [Yoonia sp.]|uniref:MBL fold metallo-hydrolase n=1 Tax=Yoonia sp. TaxID=2212373 RepID=UPI0019E2510E|nr:MBL fold metallo-hydrolase [Yoonia sp.]MBE0414092.1 MBL fold metallo-hydrolase [Yoonia sp.]
MPDFTPMIGTPQVLAPLLSVVVAPNASPMTHTGTNTYVLGDHGLAVIDPGPDDPVHLAAVLRAIAGRAVSHILLTHSHLDHSPLARRLSALTGAPVCAFGDSQAGRSAIMQSLAQQGLTGGGEWIDHEFTPDTTLADGAVVTGQDWALTAVHTPGHIGNHLCFRWGQAIFTGDHVMGWASSLVSPPDGDLGDFMRSCSKLRALDARVFYPGHGAPVSNPHARLDWLIAHRTDREKQIIAALSAHPQDLMRLTLGVYVDTPAALLGAAARNVFAHLIELHQRGQVHADPHLHKDATFSLRQTEKPTKNE